MLELPVTAGVTAVVTEESAGDWQARHQRLDLGGNVCLYCRPFANQPTSDEFSRLLEQFLQLKAERNLDLVVFDPLADFLPARENDPPACSTRPSWNISDLYLDELCALDGGVATRSHPRPQRRKIEVVSAAGRVLA